MIMMMMMITTTMESSCFTLIYKYQYLSNSYLLTLLAGKCQHQVIALFGPVLLVSFKLKLKEQQPMQ